MPTTVNIHEAKTHLSRLLARVAEGEEGSIAKNGKPIARMVPANAPVSNNIAEGFERGATNQLLSFLCIAPGSAGEVRFMLGYFESRSAHRDFKSQISHLKSLAESCSRHLRAWADALQNSDITRGWLSCRASSARCLGRRAPKLRHHRPAPSHQQTPPGNRIQKTGRGVRARNDGPPVSQPSHARRMGAQTRPRPVSFKSQI